jgi:hypothetical protein
LGQGDRHKRERNDAGDDAERPEARWIRDRKEKLASYAGQQPCHAVDTQNPPPVFRARAGVQPALHDNEHAGETEPGERPRRYPQERVHHKEVHERRGRGDRSEGCEGSNVANPPYDPCGEQRSNDDAAPEACAHCADFTQGEAPDFATDAEDRPLKGIAGLHEKKAQQKRRQCRNCGRQGAWHLLLLSFVDFCT